MSEVLQQLAQILEQRKLESADNSLMWPAFMQKDWMLF